MPPIPRTKSPRENTKPAAMRPCASATPATEARRDGCGPAGAELPGQGTHDPDILGAAGTGSCLVARTQDDAVAPKLSSRVLESREQRRGVRQEDLTASNPAGGHLEDLDHAESHRASGAARGERHVHP